MTEPQELEAPRADITGKEPVPITGDGRESSVLEQAARELDQDKIIRAVAVVERLYPKLAVPAGEERNLAPYKLSTDYRESLRTDFDEVGTNLHEWLEEYHTEQLGEYRKKGLSIVFTEIQDQIETRFHEAVDHVQHSTKEANRDKAWAELGPHLAALMDEDE